jgi:hypothetical protein
VSDTAFCKSEGTVCHLSHPEQVQGAGLSLVRFMVALLLTIVGQDAAAVINNQTHVPRAQGAVAIKPGRPAPSGSFSP